MGTGVPPCCASFCANKDPSLWHCLAASDCVFRVRACSASAGCSGYLHTYNRSLMYGTSCTELDTEHKDNQLDSSKTTRKKETREHKEVKETKLYIGNLDPRVTEYHIINLFRPFGHIVKEEFAWHTHGAKKGEPRGFCFIEFETKEEATQALNKMVGKQVLGRPLSIHFSDDQARPPQPKHTSTPLLQSTMISDSESKNTVQLSNEAMEAKIFAIKTKLQLMEKEKGAGDIATSRDSRIPSKHNNKNKNNKNNNTRYDPYFKHKYT